MVSIDQLQHRKAHKELVRRPRAYEAQSDVERPDSRQRRDGETGPAPLADSRLALTDFIGSLRLKS